jgi:hypothetical protein
MLKIHESSTATTRNHGADAISGRKTAKENYCNRNGSRSHIMRPNIKD